MISEGKGSQLLVGTTRNCILTGTPDLGFRPIILGHTDELWGLASHHEIPQFATAGYDKVLQLWDSMSHSILWSKDIGVGEINFRLLIICCVLCYTDKQLKYLLGTSTKYCLFPGW